MLRGEHSSAFTPASARATPRRVAGTVSRSPGPEPIRRGAPSIETLSDGELEVFAMTGRGWGARRVAALLHLSPKTIQAYHARIKDKLRLSDANELMREAIGWTERAGKRNRRTTRPPDGD
ncbi:MAG: LuxR C-terminal-related transcriptional regulator [Verrucomicrobiia bacterium]